MPAMSWTLGNFCRGNPKEVVEQIKPVLGALVSLINSEDGEVLDNACLALCILAGTPGNTRAVIETGICLRLVEIFMHPSSSVAISALDIVACLIASDDVQQQWDNMDKLREINWNFFNLENAFEEGGELHGKTVYMFGSTEAEEAKRASKKPHTIAASGHLNGTC